jgi:TrbL/VirB6 plasmid conjugal transfer protein
MNDYFSFVFDGINKILSQHSSFFESMGMELFRSFALILICWFGVQSALSGAEGGPGFSWTRFSSLVQELILVYVMLAFYTVPIPGIGISFTHLVLDQVTAMVSQLDQARVQEIIETLNVVESNLPYPGPLEILAIIRFFILIVCILAAQAVTLYVVMFGYVATAVLMLLGPVFIPFKLVPKMDWLFWGWFRAFFQFAFYQVVASAYVFIFGDFLMQFFLAKKAPMSTEELAYLFVPMVLTLVTFILGTIKVPSLTFSLFSGRSGEYVFLRWR